MRTSRMDSVKAWILLTSLGATVVGWMVLPGLDSSAERTVLSPKATMPSADVLALPVNAVEEPKQPGSSVRSMPMMPQRPVFQAPVTRTRRS
jgi:hypothetical protein